MKKCRKGMHGKNKMMKGEICQTDKYVDLEKSCLSNLEKKQVMDMLYKYKDAFHLRDEIGTCPNMVVEIDITDKSSFLIRPVAVKEEEKNILYKECFGIFESSYVH